MVVGMLPQTTFATGAEEQVNPWHGKSAVFVGDSITAGSGTEKIYYQYLSEVLGFGSATAMGVAGSCISSASDYGQSNQPLISRYESIPSADLIVIFMGTNDYGHETPLGTAADTQEGSFYGALNTIIPSLVEKHASSKIVFVTPLHRYGFGTSKILGTQFTYDNIPNGVGATLEDYVNALKAICAANSVSVIDLYTECTLDPTDSAVRASYMPDGLHPNAAGHEVIAGIMASHIREMTPAEGTEEQTELIYGNKFAAGFNQQNRASSRTNLYLKAGTVVALKDPEIFQWTCAKTSNESSNNNLGYFPDSAWTEKATAVVEADGWVGFAFKYRDESQTFDLSKPLSDYIHIYTPAVTVPTCTEQGYTTYTCICGDSYVDTYVDALTHDYLATVTYPTGVVKGYTDYTCSVCGDSYRTAWLDGAAYEGMTIACIGDSITYGVGVTKDQTDYVKLLADQLGMDYIRLGASGTTLCTDGSRTCNIGKLTESNLSGADVVTIAMGINDFCAAGEGYYELGDINSTDSSTIYGAVRMWCERIVELRKTDSLSNTQFYFVTPLITSWNNSVTSAKDWDQSKVNIHGYTLRDLCNAIIEVAALYDVAVIDLNLISGLYYVDAEDNNVDVFGGDGVHPGDEGHAMMAAALANALLQNDLRNDHTHIFGSWITTTWPSCVAGEEQRVCSVCSATESSTLEANGCHRYAGVVTPPTNTQQGYTTYTCTICGDSYVGDYTEPIAPKSYRWEMQDNALVSVTTGSNTANALTLDSGSVTDGTLNSVRYSLQNKVRLYHDLPWVIEWRSSGNWDGMLFGSTMDSSVQGLTYLFRYASMHFLAFGEYTGTWNNYGIIHDIDMTVSHVFRLENRIAADGSNAVYLLVDGQEIDVMHHYYVGGTNKNQTVNWANGKDIVFANIGTSSHPMKGMKLDYLQVWENGHVHTYESTVTAPTCTEQGYTTYTCTCGDSYVDTYVDALGHNYENGKCTVCGAEHPELADYEGKVISIMGDSISTFAGYIPVADGFNREHLARYPQNNLLTDVNETWWMQVVSELDAKLGINDSWRGATLSGGPAVTTGDTGENAAMSNLTRIQNLGSNGTPDMILLYGGTNDLAHVSKVGTFDPATAPTQVDLTTKKWDNLADGFVHTLLRMRHYYPDAVIVAMLPTYTASYYSDEKLAQGNAVMAAICEHYGIAYVDLRDSGVTADHLPDGIHPGEEGMDLITAAVIETLLSDCTVELGEHVVYPVSHSLTNVNATLGHWKGVDANGTFVETLTGDNLTVQVTMGGVDVTDEVYADGVISIAMVTGALSVSAKGAYSLDGHLQQLPEKAYNTTNLWDVLTHDEKYYSADGWVVHATGKVKSVTVPVTAGDKIAATSFGAAGDNGSSINGIRVTYFSEEGVLVSMSADQVYQEFSKNGYLTVPEGAVAVCVPMWAENGAEMYILTLPAIPTEENVHLSQKTQLQPDGSFTFTLEIYASEKVAMYEDAVIRYVLNQGFAMTEKSTVRAVRMSEALKEAVLNENMAEAEDLMVTASEGVVDITGFDLSKEYISDEHSGSKLMITISYVEATDNVIWDKNIRNTSDAILAVTKVKLMASGEPEQISLQVEKVSQAQVLAAVEEFDALPMMAYSLRSSRPDVEITVPETSVEDVAAAQLRALVEKLFGSVRKWLKEA